MASDSNPRCHECDALLADGEDCEFCERVDSILESPFDDTPLKRRLAINGGINPND